MLLASCLAVPPVKIAEIQAQSPSPIYLIVAPDLFTDELAGFIELQQARGFEVRTVWLALPNPSKETIKANIQSQIPLPKYVLLVGDDEYYSNLAYTAPFDCLGTDRSFIHHF